MAVRRALAGMALALAVAVGAMGCGGTGGPSPGSGPRHVFLIVIDTLRADHLGFLGYERPTSPHLDRLAERSVVFPEAYSAASNTLESTVALFLSRHPFAGAFDRKRDNPDWVPLQSSIKQAGWDTYAVVGNPWLNKHEFFQQGFDRYRRRASWEPNTTEAITAAVTDILDTDFRPEGRSYFYIHYVDPHDPWAAPVEPAFHQTGPPERDVLALLWRQEGRIRELAKQQGAFAGRPEPLAVTAAERDYMLASYDEEIRFVDEQIGELVARLDELGVLQDSLIVVTSDHGEEFGEHRLFRHGFQLYDESLHVPLLFFWPDGLEARRPSLLAGTVDVAPTILGLLGIDAPARMVGRDLLAPGLKERPLLVATHFINQRQLGMRTREWKLLADLKTQQLAIFDLRVDAGERTNLFDGDRERFRYALEPFEAAVREHGRPQDGATLQAADEGLDENTRRQLKALGYL